ncbi:MAG: DUF1015 domain-containing protein [Candidatus Thorarchaeota archaeon]|nr:DUF1015 domain-containing protein [Candidatus Thorarchaeota archaeon]
MVRVKPFRAYRYNLTKVGSYDRVVAPPYDIIKGEMIDKFQGLSPYNIAWITKSKSQPGDNEHNNQYTRAGELLEKWLEQGVLVQDPTESFYVYGQDFEVAGKKLFRFGFIGLLGLEDFATEAPKKGTFSGVLQHEETLPKDIMDRLSLCRATMMQFGLIFVIYPDAKGEIDRILNEAMKKKPLADVVDHENVRHRIWVIDDKPTNTRITELMADKYVIIADGHHRYKTALQLSKENPQLEAARHRMVAFVNISNPGLVILPTHRVVQNLENFDSGALLKGISSHFTVETYDSTEKMFAAMSKQFDKDKHSFGLFVNDGKFYVLTLKDERAMEEVLPKASKELRRLDVSILHSLILDRLLGIDKAKLSQGTMKGGGYVTYIKGVGEAVEEAIRAVKEGAHAAFFMNPTRVRDVESVSRNFEVMPQKSTFFQPKVWTGFTMNRVK